MNRKPKKLPRVFADRLRFVSVNMKLSGVPGYPKSQESAILLQKCYRAPGTSRASLHHCQA
jgi:hypothetical protein